MPRVLVVEDRPIDRKLLTTLLRSEGYAVVEAIDGEDALSALASAPVDLVISDILMPTVDGYEFVRRLRGLPGLADIPVIFYTATYHEREAHTLARQCGVTAILIKPSEPGVIVETVRAALRSTPRGAAAPDPESFDREHLRVMSDKLVASVDDAVAGQQRMAAVIDIAQRISAEQDPSLLLGQVCTEVRRATLAQHALLGLLDDDLTTVRSLITSGLDDESKRAVALPSIDDTLITSVVGQRQVLRGRSPGGHSRTLGLPGDVPVFSYLLVPIASSSRVYGWIGLRNKVGADEFAAEDEGVASALATHAAIAYENARLFEDLRSHAGALEREIGDRRRAEQALRLSEERTRFALAAAKTGVWEWDLLADRVAWSETMPLIFGLTPPEAPATIAGFFDMVHPDDREHVRKTSEQAIDARADLRIDFRIVWRDGSVHWISTTGRAAYDAHGKAVRVLGTGTDITDRKSLEEQLRQAQKMEAIGQVAGGVAHDFNNLLTAILGYANLVSDALDPDDASRQDVLEIAKAAEHAAALTRQLLAFSRRQVLVPEILDVNALIASVTQLLRRVIGEQIELHTKLAPDVAPIRADPVQLEQIILNLAVNARDAMPSGGRLAIETASVDVDPSYALQHISVEPGRYVLLTVSDTGVGMDEDTRRRLFEPFFTTKGPGRGTGLGLATVYGIVKQSGGHIWVYSEPNLGATFKIFFPPAEGVADVKPAPVDHKPVRGSETVLIVEDERAVRLLSRVILERAGFRVFDAASPAEAEAAFGDRLDAIDLLISDIVMPGSTGPAMYERLLQRRPGLKVLYMSGYANDTIMQNNRLNAGTAFMGKPFTAEGLARKVREVLDR